MRLAVSNIAWAAGADARVAPLLIEGGAEGVEVAPTKVWPKPLEASGSDILLYRRWWEGRGLRVVALQALLFGRPDLTLFGGDVPRRATLAYLKGMVDLASALGAGALVFGSPKNRLLGGLSRDEGDRIAAPFFREIGDHAGARGVFFCVEANPSAYGCDYVTTTAEAAALVGLVGSEGFGLHIDTGGMTLSCEDVPQVLSSLSVPWRHFHVSEPHLGPVGRGGTDHRAFARAVRHRVSDGWISIEMKEPTPESSASDILRDSIAVTGETYGRIEEELSIA